MQKIPGALVTEDVERFFSGFVLDGNFPVKFLRTWVSPSVSCRRCILANVGTHANFLWYVSPRALPLYLLMSSYLKAIRSVLRFEFPSYFISLWWLFFRIVWPREESVNDRCGWLSPNNKCLRIWWNFMFLNGDPCACCRLTAGGKRSPVGPSKNEYELRALVRFRNESEALRAWREKQGSFCMEKAVDLRFME